MGNIIKFKDASDNQVFPVTITTAVYDTSNNTLDTLLSGIRSSFGTPVAVTSASAMTDNTKIYIYMGSEAGYTNGDWYYYANSSWNDGGVYNAVAVDTDTTLTVSDMAADAKVVGDYINYVEEGAANLQAGLTESTKNINTVSVGKYDTDTSGVIKPINASFGMSDKVACKGNTTYTASYYNATCSGSPSGHISTYTLSGDFIERLNITASNDSVTFTTDSSAKYVHVGFYKSGGFTIESDAGIQIELGSTKTAYVEPYTVKGLSEVSEKVDDIEKDIQKSSFVGKMQVPVPSMFSWTDNPLKNKIYSDYKGNITCDFDVADYKNALGTVKYVSPSGSDSNTGDSMDSPYLSMATAYNNGADTIMCMPGLYMRTNIIRNSHITRSLNIIGTGEGVILTTCSNSSMSILSGYEHVYSASRSTFTGVVDIVHLNEFGDYTKYTEVDSIQAVEDTEGSWAHISGIAYVHTIDDTVPNSANGILLMATDSTSLISFQGNGTLYIENLIGIDGMNSLLAQSTSSTDILKVYGKNCKFFYSKTTSYDAVTMQGVSEAIFQNCEASYAMKDGFNYHARDGIIPKAIEINCIAKNNGNIEDGDDQGTTIHEGGSIIRVNDVVCGSYGANYSDQGEGTQSWNIGCVGFASRNVATVSQNANFLALAGITMIMDSCVGFGSTWNVNSTNAANENVYVRNCRFEGTLAPEGQVIHYY